MIIDDHDIAISVIAGNTSDTLDIFFHWATTNFSEVNVVCQPDNYDDTLDKCTQWANKFPSIIKLQVHEFDNFSAQFQRAIDMCTKSWCIQLGADEILAEFPYSQIPNLMNRMGKKAGILPRFNLQRTVRMYGRNTYPDHQKRVIKMGEGIAMDGNIVDETLAVDPSDCAILNTIPIIHFGHIRPEAALKQKGRDRIRFAAQDKCDGQQLNEVGIDWFIVRNKAWDEQAVPLPREIASWVQRWIPGGHYFWSLS